ncbi:hypothetical protein MKX03_036606 [Papaver bracteatum]|nr:hypothetical protein MKX03_036606 [Papaver bracteatum]
MELDKKLKILNKPPMKSIETEIGDIYDCINIYKQPAFDHPLLRNHKIQMEPNVIQEEQIDESIYNMVPRVGRSKLKGTTKKELINAKYLSSWVKRRHYVSAQPLAEKVYYGGSANIAIANPSVEQNTFSTGQIWIQSGPTAELNSIEFGWAVFPQLFGDNETRVFGLWTGFVQVHPEYSFGEHIKDGTYGGAQRGFYFSVHRDPESGNWWFINGINNAKIGYWPKEIFTHLASNASVIAYGGVAGTDIGKLTPPMGHGHLSVFDSRYTCCMQSIKVVQLNRDTKSSCYVLIFPGSDILLGILMFFGGPGGDCP